MKEAERKLCALEWLHGLVFPAGAAANTWPGVDSQTLGHGA